MRKTGAGIQQNSKHWEVCYAGGGDPVDYAITGHHVSPLLQDSQVCSRTLVTSSVRPRCVGSEKGSETNKDLRGYDDNVREPVGDVCNHGNTEKPVFFCSRPLCLPVGVFFGIL